MNYGVFVAIYMNFLQFTWIYCNFQCFSCNLQGFVTAILRPPLHELGGLRPPRCTGGAPIGSGWGGARGPCALGPGPLALRLAGHVHPRSEPEKTSTADHLTSRSSPVSSPLVCSLTSCVLVSTVLQSCPASPLLCLLCHIIPQPMEGPPRGSIGSEGY